MCERKTADQMALEILVDNKPRKQERLGQLATAVLRALESRIECPHCGHDGPHEDNGAIRRSELSYLCAGCGLQFDAET